MRTDIVQCFTEHPLRETDNRLEWFNDVAVQLFDITHVPVWTAHQNTQSALVAWKDAGNGSVKYDDPVVVTFNSLYVRALLSLSNDFTAVDFQDNLRKLIEVRQDCTDVKVRQDIKAFLNTIFGQMNTGLIRHSHASTNDIVSIGRGVVQSLYDSPHAVYADTDEVVFSGLTPTEVHKLVQDTVDTTVFPYDVTGYSSIEIHGRKKETRTEYRA